jgi:hypothetical protein
MLPSPRKSVPFAIAPGCNPSGVYPARAGVNLARGSGANALGALLRAVVLVFL